MNGRQRRPDPEGRGMVLKLPDDLHEKVRAAAGARKVSMKGFCLKLIANALEGLGPGGLKAPRGLA